MEANVPDNIARKPAREKVGIPYCSGRENWNEGACVITSLLVSTRALFQKAEVVLEFGIENVITIQTNHDVSSPIKTGKRPKIGSFTVEKGILTAMLFRY